MLMRSRFLKLGLLSLVLLAGVTWLSSLSWGQCVPPVVKSANQYAIKIGSASTREIEEHFFGFNVDWIGFQDDLFDSSSRRVKPEIVQYLQAFPGAVYRFPGGTVANFYDWRAGVGSREARPARKVVDWKPPISNLFGFHEYLDFLEQVGGQGWLVANLYGAYGVEQEVSELSDLATSWAQESAKLAKAGKPKILRWELGNELDRGGAGWSPEKYADRAMSIASALRVGDPGASFVAMLEDYDARKNMRAQEYNQRISSTLAFLKPEFANHLYYDGKPGGPSVQNRLQFICGNQDAITRGRGFNGHIWVTEHARWPPGKIGSPEWKANWSRTTSLEGALSVADMVIGLARIPNVEGAFLHSLSGTYGPWPFFHRTSEGLRPGVIYWTLRLMRESLLNQVLDTNTESRNDSGYVGGYDLRAVAMTNQEKSKYALWMVNRHSLPIRVKLAIPALHNQQKSTRVDTLSDNNPNANNVLVPDRLVSKRQYTNLSFDNAGEVSVELPAYSVSAWLIGEKP